MKQKNNTKIYEIKCLFFEKINKTDKSQARLIRRKRKTQIASNRKRKMSLQILQITEVDNPNSPIIY